MKNNEDTEDFLIRGIDILRRRVMLDTEIDFELVGLVIRGIQLMLDRSESAPIHVYISTFGGCPYASFGLYDFIKSLDNTTVYTYAMGGVMSGGTIIFSAGDHRIIYPNVVIMLHSVSSAAEGKVYPNLVNETEECKTIHMEMMKIYASVTNLSKKQWHNKLKYEDIYLRRDKIMELGFADAVIGETE